MILGVAGAPGTGKTYYLRHAIRQALDQGHTVWIYDDLPAEDSQALSYGLLGRRLTVRDVANGSPPLAIFGERDAFGELLAAAAAFRNVVLVVDEVTLYMRSGGREQLGRPIERWLRLHRHYGVALWWATQTIRDANRFLVRLTDQLHLFRMAGKEDLDYLSSWGLPAEQVRNLPARSRVVVSPGDPAAFRVMTPV